MLRTPISLNRYTYGNGDPLEHFDPDGRFSIGLGSLGSRLTSMFSGSSRSGGAGVGGAIGMAASKLAAKAKNATVTRSSGAPSFSTSGCDDNPQAFSACRRRLERRYESNRQAIKNRIAQLEDDLDGAGRGRAKLQKEINLLKPLASRGRQIYQFDPSGDDYKIAEVNGDLLGARNIGVVVGGTNQGLHNFDKDVGAKAKRLKAAAGGSTATVAWLGYDAPNSAAQGFNKRPVDGGRRLAGFVNSVARDNPSARMTVIGHSYGSPVVGEAMRNGLRADNTVHTGSPGLGLGAGARSVKDTGFGGRVYAAQAEGDDTVTKTVPICSSYPPYCAQLDPHGPAPLELSGVRRLDATGSQGHNEYYDTGSTSLTSIASVVTGTVREQDSGLWGAGS